MTGVLPAALLAAALGVALAFASSRNTLLATLAFVVSAIATSFLPADPSRSEAIFSLCWASVAVTALSIHLRALRARAWWMIALGANAGLWTGALIGVAGTPLDLTKALPWALLSLPGAWVMSQGLGLGLKIVASWLVAVSLLAAFLPLTTPTPGYAADHME